MIFIILILIVLVILFLANKKINIDFKTFLKKGFKKLDNKFGLYLYTGKQGKGKTFSAIKFCEKYRQKGYYVVTNIKSYSKNKNCIYIQNIFEIIQFCKMYEGKYKFIVFFDEIFTVLTKNVALDSEILSFLSQLRKRNIILVSTAQEWSEINITFRRYCRYQINCNMISLPIIKIAVCINTLNDGDNIKWNNDTQEFEAELINTKIFKCNLDVVNKYDTFETIDLSTKPNTKTEQKKIKK